jgi:hypothetical protein
MNPPIRTGPLLRIINHHRQENCACSAFFAVGFLPFFENPASESAIAMACFRSVTFGPFLEPESNVPSSSTCLWRIEYSERSSRNTLSAIPQTLYSLFLLRYCTIRHTVSPLALYEGHSIPAAGQPACLFFRKSYRDRRW